MPVLFIHPKQGDSFTFTLGENRISLGRTRNNDIVLNDHFSSQNHAAIIPTQTGYAIQDLDSKNGTYLNGRRLSEQFVLAKGDEIQIGSTRILFDPEMQTSVKVVEDEAFTSSSSTSFWVKDILKKTAVDEPLTKADGSPDLDRIQKNQKLLAVLGEVSQALMYHMELDKLLEHIMDLIAQNVPMDRGILMLKEGSEEDLVPKVVRIQSSLLRTENLLISQSILRASLEKNSAILISDIKSEKWLSEQRSVIAAQIHSAMCVPLWNNKAIIGVIYCDRTSLIDQFSEDDLRLLTLLANLAAIKVENARLAEEAQEKKRMEQELLMAQKIQQNLLPKEDPDFEPYDISGSARACQQVGGDYFDFIPMDPSRLGIVIADVSGHGVSSALLMAALRSSLHAMISPTSDLALLAAKLNDTIYRDSDSHTFISFFFGVLNRDKGEMWFVNAGHNPPLLVNRAGGIRSLDSTGFCLGMFPSVKYETATIVIETGEILCLFTDGVVESQNEDREEFGDERLIRQLQESADLPARDILRGIYEGVSGFTAGAEPADDITIVVVKSKSVTQFR